MQLSSTIVDIFSILTLFGNILFVVLVVLFVALKIMPKNKTVKKYARIVSENSITGIFIVSAFATAGSLSFSEIAAFVPCKLCWFQRIFMYPIALISFIALIKNDNGVKKYVLPLSLIGAVIAIYHILVQMFPQALECSDEVAKCSAVEFATFGYITIPVMSLSAFLLIIILSLFKVKNPK